MVWLTCFTLTSQTSSLVLLYRMPTANLKLFTLRLTNSMLTLVKAKLTLMLRMLSGESLLPLQECQERKHVVCKSVQRTGKGRFIFATINPNSVDFKGQTLALLNRQDAANSEYVLEKTAAANKLITRAEAKGQRPV